MPVQESKDGSLPSYGSQFSVHEGMLAQREPIAIVGMGCRLPGDSNSPEKLWRLLSQNRSGHGNVPQSRYNASAFYHPNKDRPGSINSSTGYFIDEDIRNFDNTFFNISNIEAIGMDPQQRKLLEVAFECFESAGATLEGLSGANVGCYVGNFALDFPLMQLSDTENINRYSAAGATPTLLANRISHVFNLRGPSFVIDTGCSSSLYGLHCACTALDLKECDAAVVAGANLIQLPQQQILATKTGIISNSATCRTFDATADGYGRAEGVGALYLKRLSDAIRDRDPIRSVIRGTAVNSNGRTPGVMQPSSDGQELVIRKAYARAGILVYDTDYVEAHGTGTAIGDPTEVEAISRVFSEKRGRPILVGSVKTNLGHSEATSGISSVIKVVLALENRMIPATINITNINPKISEQDLNIEIVRSQTPWPASLCPRASVNSFGFGGANSHAVIEAFQDYLGSQILEPDKTDLQWYSKERLFLLPVSAHSRFSLERRMSDLKELRVQSMSSNIGPIAHTLSSRRTRLPYRAYLLAHAVEGSEQLEISHSSVPQLAGPIIPITFVFTGQGAQWNKMGCQLFKNFKVFRESIQKQDSSLSSHRVNGPWTLVQMLSDTVPNGTPVDINHPDVSQVLCTAVQLALIDLTRSWEVEPSAVVGHSSGEIAAAYAAGFISCHEAILLAYYRGVAVSMLGCTGDRSLPRGAMLGVSIDSAEAIHYIEELGIASRVDLACINSPNNVTVSGDVDAIHLFKEKIDSFGIFNRILKTGSVAYHSHHMRQGIGQQYQHFIDTNIAFNSSTSNIVSGVTMISTVTGQFLSADEACRSSYWRQNLENTVLFDDALSSLFALHDTFIIEIGPHPALQVPIKEIRSSVSTEIPQTADAYSATLFRDRNEVNSMLNLAGILFSYGYELGLDELNQIKACERTVFVSLPPYAWDYQNVVPWKEPRASTELRNRQYCRHELLGSLMAGGSGMSLVWRSIISTNDVPWLSDHRFGSNILFPAAGFISMAVAAVCQANNLLASDFPTVLVRQTKLFHALTVPEDGSTVELFTELRRLPISEMLDSREWWQFRIGSVVDGEHVGHVAGRIACQGASNALATQQIVYSSDSMEPQAVRIWYEKLAEAGVFAGPTFRVVQGLHVDRMRRQQKAQAKIQLNRGMRRDDTDGYEYFIHPTTIDGLLQIGFFAATAGRFGAVPSVVPVSIDDIDIITSSLQDSCPDGLWNVRSRAAKTGFASILADSELYSGDGNVLLRIKRARAAAYQGIGESFKADGPRTPTLRVCWKPDITFLDSRHGSEQLAALLSETYDAQGPHTSNGDTPVDNMITECLDFVAHKRPNERILFLNLSPQAVERSVLALGAGQSYRRFAAIRCMQIESNGKLSDVTTSIIKDESILDTEQLDFSKIGIVVADFRDKPELIHHLQDNLSQATEVLLILPSDAIPTVKGLNRPVISATQQSEFSVALVLRSLPPPPLVTNHIYLVGHSPDEELNREISRTFHKTHGISVSFVPFSEIVASSITPGSRIILTMEADMALLDRLGPQDLERLQLLTGTAASLLWVTRGKLLKSNFPEMALAWGAARAIRLEEPQLQLAMYDFDGASTPSITAGNIFKAFQEAFAAPARDLEFIESNGIVHVSRWVSDEPLNRIFQDKRDMKTSPRRLDSCGSVQLSLQTPGQLDAIRFERQPDEHRELVGEEIEVEAKYYGMNAKDLYLLSDKFDAPGQCCSQEFAGVVRRVGPGAKFLSVGDRVVVVAPGKYRNIDIVPEFACAKLLPTEDFESLSTLPLVFTTAIYALKFLANLRPGESVLIHSACGGVGLAAIQVARWLGATIFATAGTQDKREWLSQNYDIPISQIYSSRDDRFLPAILDATSQRGVDVVLNSLTGELLHASFRACAPLGRFIEIGKKDIFDGGRLDMSTFRRSVSFISFDLFDLMDAGQEHGRNVWRSLLETTLNMFRERVIKAIEPRRVFDISEITQAFRFFAQPSRIGKVAVSMDNPGSMIELLPTKFDSKFDHRKSYIMVGCFGGIGTSITKWMVSLGARNFVFLSRSGRSKQSATNLVADLEAAGCRVEVVAGDVSQVDDVRKAFKCATSEIGGIVHASMSVRAIHWESLTCEDWHYGIQAKVQGTRNLHEALAQGHENALDFFLLISSISGTIGSPTEPSYCAANAYMDSFARFRRAQGRKAVSLALGVITEVGYLHEHPQMEAVYRRRGLQASNEEELLHLVDLAIAYPDSDGAPSRDSLMNGHLLTGLEMQVAKAQAMDPSSMAFEILFQDPRAGLLKASYDRDMKDARTAASLSKSQLPQQVREAVLNGESIQSAVCKALVAKFSSIMMMHPDQLRHDQPLANFGLDSMLAAEFRTFVFQALQVDIPFMTLLSKNATMDSIVAIVVEQMR
ncbi:putative polyketide synthase [Ustulina deusta]|nr:putative polyketide synthase [Ustulina deusta]